MTLNCGRVDALLFTVAEADTCCNTLPIVTLAVELKDVPSAGGTLVLTCAVLMLCGVGTSSGRAARIGPVALGPHAARTLHAHPTPHGKSHLSGS